MVNHISINDYKKILVTGGAGFIGGALIRKLLLTTESTVFNLDKMGYASDLTSIDETISNANIERSQKFINLQVDLANKVDTNKAVEKADPDIIFHLAAESHVDRSIDKPDCFIESNIIGTFNILEASRDHWNKLEKRRKSNFKFMHISTDEVFGSLGQKGFFSEVTKYAPKSPYSASKASSDHLVKSWHNTYGLPTIITNCSNNFGPWQFPEKLIPLVILKILKGQEIPIYGKGDNIRDWLYVNDHVNALIMASIKGDIGQTYCIGGNQEKTNLQVVEEICEILNKIKPSFKDNKRLIRFVNDRPGHDFRYAIDSSKIKNEIGWKPRKNFSEALYETVEWYANRVDWCQKIKMKSHYGGKRMGNL